MTAFRLDYLWGIARPWQIGQKNYTTKTDTTESVFLCFWFRGKV